MKGCGRKENKASEPKVYLFSHYLLFFFFFLVFLLCFFLGCDGKEYKAVIRERLC